MPLRGICPAPLSCQSAYLPYATIIRRVRPWRRAYSRGIISHGLSCRCGELCLFEALHPAPLARPFSKGLLEGDYLTRAFMPLQRIVPLRGTPSCAFGAALLQGPTRGDYLTWAFMPLRRIVPLRGTLSCAFGAALLQGPTRGRLSHLGFHAATANCASSRHCNPLPLARPFSKGLLAGNCPTFAFMPPTAYSLPSLFAKSS